MSGPDLRVTTLANGLVVATEAMGHVATASVGVWIGAGSRNERPDEHGLSHLIEHMAFKGTQARSARAIAEDIENVGGDINAATSVEYTCYTARTLGTDVGVALDVLGDILTRSTFAPEELERERGVILQEIASVEDAPDDLVNDLFLESAFPDQAIGRPILGRPETVGGFTPDAIRAFLSREYTPDRMVIAAAGAVEHEEVVDAAHRFFGDWRAGPADPVLPGFYGGGERRLLRSNEQANVVLGFPGCSFKDPAHHATQIFAHILGGSLSSRLWQEVREKRGLAYGVDAFHWPFSDCGVFGIGAGTAGADLPEFIDVTLAAFQDAAETASEAEIARAKAQVKVGMLATMEASGGRIERIARQFLAWGRLIPVRDIVERVEAVTVEEVREVGRSLLTGTPSLAAIGPIRRLPSLDRIRRKLGNA